MPPASKSPKLSLRLLRTVYSPKVKTPQNRRPNSTFPVPHQRPQDPKAPSQLTALEAGRNQRNQTSGSASRRSAPATEIPCCAAEQGKRVRWERKHSNAWIPSSNAFSFMIQRGYNAAVMHSRAHIWVINATLLRSLWGQVY